MPAFYIPVAPPPPAAELPGQDQLGLWLWLGLARG